MNTPVDYELAKLLKDNGFDNIKCDAYYHVCDGYTKGYAFCYSDVNTQKETAILAPTIAEVVMWLYDEHGIWCWVEIDDVKYGLFNYVVKWYNGLCLNESRGKGYKLPTEAYTEAIFYCLINLINGVKKDIKSKESNNKELYSQIEHLVIIWSNDGTKTAGHLTRSILKLLDK